MLQCLKLNSEKTVISDSTRVIKATEYQSFVAANMLIAQAQKQSEQFVKNASESVKKMRKAAYVEGLEQGQKESTEQIVRLSRQVDHYLLTLEKQLSEFVMQAVQKIVKEFDDNTLVMSAVRKGLKQMRDQKQLTLRVAPELVQETEHSIAESIQDNIKIEVIGDAKLSGGDCVLESEIGIVNSSVPVQLQALTASLSAQISK